MKDYRLFNRKLREIYHDLEKHFIDEGGLTFYARNLDTEEGIPKSSFEKSGLELIMNGVSHKDDYLYPKKRKIIIELKNRKRTIKLTYNMGTDMFEINNGKTYENVKLDEIKEKIINESKSL